MPVVVTAALWFVAPMALAIKTFKQCDDLPKDTRCYSGATFESYLNVRASVVKPSGYDAVVYGLCAKAVTAANNVKSGSVCGDTDFIRACLAQISPQSRGYGSHSGNAFFYNSVSNFFSSAADIQAAAATPADTVGVCGR